VRVRGVTFVRAVRTLPAMRRTAPLALAFALAACSAPPAPPPDAPPADASPADAPADTADDFVSCAGLHEGDPCDCAEPFRGRRGVRVCASGWPTCFCHFPDADAEASPDVATDAIPAGDAAPDAAVFTDAAPTSEDAVAVADASRDVPPDRYSCADEGAPRCSDHGACAVCLPAADGTTWCCRSGFCRPAPDRSTCE